MSTTSHLGPSKGKEAWTAVVVGESREGGPEERCGQASCRTFSARVYLDSIATIFLEKNKPLPRGKQLPYLVGYCSSLPLESCIFFSLLFGLFSFLFCVGFFFVLSFLLSCILTPAEETAISAHSGCQRLAVGCSHTISSPGIQTGTSVSMGEPEKHSPGSQQTQNLDSGCSSH